MGRYTLNIYPQGNLYESRKRMEITYKEFLYLVQTANGPFSYRFFGTKHVCDPVIYKAVHGWRS